MESSAEKSMSYSINSLFDAYNSVKERKGNRLDGMKRWDREIYYYDTAADFWYGLIDITPQYKFERGDMTVNLGVTLSGKFISNKEAEVDKYHNFISPAVKLTFSLLKERLWLYGVLDGKNHLNAWSSILQENRYINPAYSPANLFAGSTPLNAEMGLKGRATDKFTYNIYARYAVHKGMLQYAYFKEEGWYNTFNSNHNEFGAGAEVTAKMENFIIVGIIVVIVSLACIYIYRSKKSGNKCIGCPHSKVCGSRTCKCNSPDSNNTKE